MRCDYSSSTAKGGAAAVVENTVPGSGRHEDKEALLLGHSHGRPRQWHARACGWWCGTAATTASRAGKERTLQLSVLRAPRRLRCGAGQRGAESSGAHGGVEHYRGTRQEQRHGQTPARTEAKQPGECGEEKGGAAEERTERLSGEGNQSWASPLG